MFNYFVRGARGKAQDAKTGIPMYPGDSEKGSIPKEQPCWVTFRQIDTKNHRHWANPQSFLISLLLPSTVIPFARNESVFPTQEAQGMVTPLHLKIGCRTYLSSKGKSS